MEEVMWAAAAAVVVLVPPVRRRFLPVSKAVLSAGLGVGTAALRGLEGVIVAAACGDQSAGDENGSVEASHRPAAARAAKQPRSATAKAR